MSFLSNMPSRKASNFSLMFSGDTRTGGSYRHPATGVREYIALHDTRPPEGQVIGMCQGHSVLGYNWHQHVSCPAPEKQRGLKRTVSNTGGGGSVPWVSSTAFASKTVGSPQSRNAESAQGYGGGSGSIRSATSGGNVDSAESNCDNGNDVMRAADTVTFTSLSRHNAPKPAVAAEVTASEAVGSMIDPPKSRSAAATATALGEESARGLGHRFGTQGLLGAEHTRSRGGSSSFSIAAGRGRLDVAFSEEGEALEAAAVAAAATTTQGRVGMRKARRTYGR